jgi:iron complex outermembrane receptor protein|uniref:TonB-dependent receptor n=1 Tax=Desulfobacca acetoxidans TaxID=60893 RepID=A0A7V6A5Q0_9BACT
MGKGRWGRLALFVPVALVFLAAGVSGEEQGAPPVAKEETVTAVKEQSEQSEQPGKAEKLPTLEVVAAPEPFPAPTASVITKDQMAFGPDQNLPGYLEEESGIDLTRRSLLGEKSSQLNIRGFDESRYQVYMNGRSVKGVGVYGGYYVDWSTLDLMGIEKVQIIRGAQSAEYGNTLGGVVNITTMKGSKDPKVNLDASYGSWDTQNYRLAHTGSYGPVEYALGGSFSKTTGYLRNNFVDPACNFLGNFTYHCPWDMDITLGGRYGWQDTGMIVANRAFLPFYNPDHPSSDGDILFGPQPPFLVFKPGKGGGYGYTYGDHSFVDRRFFTLDLAVKQKLWKGEVEGNLFYFQTARRDKFYALNNSDLLILDRHSLDEDTWGWNLKTHQTIGKVKIGLGLEGNYLGYGPLANDFYNPVYFRGVPSGNGGNKNAERIYGGFIDGTIFVTDWCEVYLGLRYDNYFADKYLNSNTNTMVPPLRRDFVTPKSTVIIRPTKNTEGYLSVNFANRFPTIPEVYWFGNGYIPPSRAPVLEPEFGMQYEAGITQKFPYNVKMRVRGYYYDLNNYIHTVFGFRPSRVVYNIDLASFRGVEVEGTVGLPYHLTAFANYTWQQTGTSPDPLGGNVRYLPEFPEHKANIGLQYKNAEGAEAKFSVRMVSQRYQPQVLVNTKKNQVTGSFLRRMKGFFTINLEGRYPVFTWEGFHGFLYAGVSNLTGEFYEESAGFPMPVQTYYGGLQLRY